MNSPQETSPCSPAEPHPYLSLFHQHLTQVQEHLKGIAHQSACSPSIIGSVLWTGAEKDAFFHALSVYSRFRSDLIALCVGTKNEVEVLEYLGMLEKGSQNYRVGVSYRRELPIAHEVSDTWIAWEEDSAERLRANEERWAELPKGSAIIEEEIASGEASKHRPRSSSTHAASLSGLNHLTYGHLFVLGSILKQEEDKQGSVKETMFSMSDRNLASDQQVTGAGSHSLTGANSIPPTATELNILGRSILTPDPDEAQSQELTPRSRRRYNKRMYMRRKRAQLTGEEIDTTINKLRSGPRKKVVQNILASAIPSPGRQTLDSDIPAGSAWTEAPIPRGENQTCSDEEGVVDDDSLSGPAAARTQFQGIRSRFSSHMVTAETIVEVGLDLFDLPKLGKLLQYFVSGYDSSLASKDSSIDVETLSLLSEIIRDFLVQVMARVITLEEEHRRLRGTTKVWRKHSDKAGVPTVNASAIQFALKTMGLTTENKHQVFADLLGEACDPPSHSRTGYDESERLIDKPTVFQRHPLHQDICPPHYFDQQNLDLAPEVAHDMVDVDISEDLVSQLQAEVALEEEDSLADQRHENWLWKQVHPPTRYSHRLRGT